MKGPSDLPEPPPPASEISITTSGSWKNVISPVTLSNADCGYHTQRSGVINESPGPGPEKTYGFTIGGHDCIAVPEQ